MIDWAKNKRLYEEMRANPPKCMEILEQMDPEYGAWVLMRSMDRQVNTGGMTLNDYYKVVTGYIPLFGKEATYKIMALRDDFIQKNGLEAWFTSDYRDGKLYTQMELTEDGWKYSLV